MGDFSAVRGFIHRPDTLLYDAVVAESQIERMKITWI